MDPGVHRVRRWGALLIVAGLFLSGQDGLGQEPGFSLVLRDVPVAEALSTLAGVTGIDLLYGEEVTGDRRVFCRSTDEPAEVILRCIVESAGLDFYRLSSGTYVVIAGAEDAPAWGSLTGVVTDRWTGEPLPGARIGLGEGAAPGATRSNAAGLFALGGLLPGPHLITVFSPGYDPVQASIRVPPRGETRHVFALEARPLTVRPIVVDGVQAATGGLVGAGQALDRVALAEAGTEVAGAVGRSVQGVSVRPLLADVSIQGGGSGEHLLRLDGSPIYNPVAVEGLLGSFSSLALDRITVQKAGFPARAGSAVSGIVELDQSAGSPDAPETDLHLNPFNLNARVSRPLRLGSNTGSVMLAGRTTLWDAWRVPSLERALRDWNVVDPLLTAALVGGSPDSVETLGYRNHGHGSDLRSTDVHGAFRLARATGTGISGSVYRGVNSLGTELLAAGHHQGDPDPAHVMLARDAYRWTNSAAQLRWDRLVGARGTAGARIRASRHEFRSGYEMVDGTGDGTPVPTDADLQARRGEVIPLVDGNNLDEFAGLVDGEVSVGPRHTVKAGLELARTTARLRLGTLYPPVDLGAEHTRISAHVEDRISRGRWTLETGLRVTSIDGGGPHPEPRAALEWEGTAGELGPTAFRLGGGLYRQFVNQYEIANPAPSALIPAMRFWLPVTGDGNPARARHLSLEGVIHPRPSWEVRGEVYWKDLPRLPAVDYRTLLAPGGGSSGETSGQGDALESGAFLSTAAGRVRGGGVRVTRTTEHLRVQAGYDRTAGTRTVPSRFDGAEVPSPVDVPHRVLLAARVDPTHGVSLRLRGSAVWGRSWAFRRAYYELLTLHDGRLDGGIGRPGERTLPPLVEVDLGLSWSGTLLGSRVELGFDVLNVLDRRNVMDYGLRRDSPTAGSGYSVVPRFLTGLTPLLFLRAGF